MSKGKKKKPKLVAGALLGQQSSVAMTANALSKIPGQVAPQRSPEDAYLNRNEDKAKTALAGVPIIGGLTSTVMGLSNSIRGDSTSVGRNLGATVFSPTSAMRASKDAGGSNAQALQAAFNPIAGAFVTSKLAKEQQIRRGSIAQNISNQSLIANSAGTGQYSFKKGGLMFQGEGIQPLGGGDLQPISKDAVQVKANDPSQTDSVELPQAYVDHNEVIDRKNRVFSDEVKAPSGRTIAKEAARLEKMKGGGRFQTSNDRIDGKLDKLFQYQELNKVTEAIKGKPKAALGMALGPGDPPMVGGPIYAKQNLQSSLQQNQQRAYLNSTLAQRFKNMVSPAGMVPASDYQQLMGLDPQQTVGGGMRTYTKVDPLALQKADSVINAYKPIQPIAKTGKAKGGKIGGGQLYDPTFAQSQTAIGARLQQSSLNQPISPGATSYANTRTRTNPNVNWGQIGIGAATVAPNIANAFMMNKLKGPAAVRLENDIRLNRVDPSAELNSANRAYNQAKQTLTTNTAQGSNLASGIGNLLSKRLAAQNQTYGSVNQLNTQIGNQEISANQAVRFRNNQLTNNFNQNVNDFQNRKLMMASDNIANLSGKVQAYGRERNQMTRDNQAFETIMGAYGDSGVMARLYAKNPELYNSMMSSIGKKSNKMGGKLGKPSSRKSC